MKRRSIFALVPVMLLVGATAKANAAEPPATAIYFGGTILTMEGAKPSYAEAVAVRNDRIVVVGSKAAALATKGPGTQLIDLKGQTLMPRPHRSASPSHPRLAILNAKFASPFDWSFPWGDAKAVQGHDAFIAKVKTYSDGLTKPEEPLLVWGWMEPFPRTHEP